MAQQRQGAVLKHALQAAAGAGVGAGGQVAQIPLQLARRCQQTHLQLSDRHRTIRPVTIEITTAHAGGQSLSTTAATSEGVQHQTHNRHQHQEAEEATAAEKEGNDEREADAPTAVAPLVTTAAVTTAVAAGHRSGTEAASTDATTAGSQCRLGQEHHNSQGCTNQRRKHQASDAATLQRCGVLFRQNQNRKRWSEI